MSEAEIREDERRRVLRLVVDIGTRKVAGNLFDEIAQLVYERRKGDDPIPYRVTRLKDDDGRYENAV